MRWLHMSSIILGILCIGIMGLVKYLGFPDFLLSTDSSELSDRGNFTVSSESSLRTDRRAQPQKQTKTHRGNKPPAASRSAYNGPFYREGHRAFERR